MKFMTYWSIRPGCMKEAAGRFLSGQATPPQGVTVLGRFHKVDCSGGWTLSESEDPAAQYAYAAAWSDVLEIHMHPVVEDAVAGPALAKRFG